MINIPGIRSSADQSLHSLPERVAITLPVPSVICKGSCLLSVEHLRSNSTRNASAPGSFT